MAMRDGRKLRVGLGLIEVASCMLLAGCPSKPAPPTANATGAATTQRLVLLVADDPQLGQAIAREWRGRTEQEVTVRDISLAELAAASRLPGDAVIFPCGLIGQLAERGLIVPIDNATLEDADFNYRDIFDLVRLREIRWGRRTLAVPLGSPQLLLAYRSDLFEKAGLSPPADWKQYQQAIARLADRAALGDLAPAAAERWRATTEPLAAGWAGQLLLARAAAYALHRDQFSPLFRFDSLTPLIDQPPYIRALEELVAAAKTGEFGQQHLSPTQAIDELKAGHCAMAIGWPGPQGDEHAAANQTKLGFAMLPGATQTYRFATKSWETRGEDESPHVPLLSISGRMAAVSASSADPRRAENFIVWLAGREVSQQISPQSPATTLFRQSQLAASSRWTGSLSPASSRQFAEVLAESLSLPRSFPGLTLPGRLDYLSALDQAVEQAIDGTPANEALAAAARQWSAITEKLGRDGQRRASVRSLGQAD
jgi:multiple sugar transport system substrate-binding protein